VSRSSAAISGMLAPPINALLPAPVMTSARSSLRASADSSAIIAVILQRTLLGRAIYALGNKESAAYLAGVNTKGVTVICFALCGLTAALAGVLLAGYSRKAYQGMGDAYLLPGIAAVVIGGTNILGGRGRYLGTLVGVILIVLLNSVLSIMEMPEAGRQVIYGGVIILMLLVYGRSEQVTS